MKPLIYKTHVLLTEKKLLESEGEALKDAQLVYFCHKNSVRKSLMNVPPGGQVQVISLGMKRALVGSEF